MILPRLLIITDRTQARRPVEEVVDAASEAGTWFLFRDKDMEAGERRQLAERLRRVTADRGVPLSISADAELAVAVGADGVHLQSLGAVEQARARVPGGMWVGYSAHGASEAAAARRAGADYITLSPIFASASKPGYGPALGPDALSRAAEAGLSVFALAGLTPERARQCRAAGAHGVAVMGGIMTADDPAAEVRRYLAALGQE